MTLKETVNTLHVDPGRELRVEREPVDGLATERLLGGFGNAIHAVQRHQHLHGKFRGYDPKNLLCFDIGCLTGSKVMTARRTYVSAVSPLKTSQQGTNGFYYSAASGGLGPELRRCDLDSVQITGKCNSPSFMVIDNSDGELHVSFESAKSLKGKTADEKVRILAEEYPDAHFAVIGPGGENLVRYAAIAFSSHDQLKRGSSHMRFAGRGGMGAVMGSKNLLGIVVRGNKKLRQEYFRNLERVVAINKEIAKGNKTAKYREYGTYDGLFETANELGCGINDNFSRGSDERARALFERNRTLEKRSKGCQGCGIKCWKEHLDAKGNVLGKLDYEPGALLGPNLGIFDLKQTFELIRLSDELGLDSISLGVTLGHYMEMNKQLGNFDLAVRLTKEIGRGQHPLKEGVMRYADFYGGRDIAMHVKGIEFPAYLGNINPGYAFAIAGPHMSIDTYKRALSSEDNNSVQEWIENIAVRGGLMTLYDMNGLCKFAKVDFDDVASFFNSIYGQEITAEDLKDTARRAILMVKAFDGNNGFTLADDVMPARCFEDLDVMGVPHFMTPEFFEKVKEGVYEEYARQAERLL